MASGAASLRRRLALCAACAACAALGAALALLRGAAVAPSRRPGATDRAAATLDGSAALAALAMRPAWHPPPGAARPKQAKLAACPAGAVAVRAASEVPFAMCLRNTTPPNPPQLVDDLILEAGCITDCLDLPALAYAAAAGAVDGGVAESDVGEFGGLYVDVGANVGFCALMMAARGARVLAVDPLEDNVALLRGSIAANGGLDGRLEVLQVGVSAEAAEAIIHEEVGNAGNSIVAPRGADLGHLGSSLVDASGVECGKGRTNNCEGAEGLRFSGRYVERFIRLVTLDSLLAEPREQGAAMGASEVPQAERRRFTPIGLMKVDTQGHEASALRGALGLMASEARPWVIKMEYAPPWLRAKGEDPVALLRALHAMGYSVFVDRTDPRLAGGLGGEEGGAQSDGPKMGRRPPLPPAEFGDFAAKTGFVDIVACRGKACKYVERQPVFAEE